MSGDKTYPMDERYWLLTTCYNTGIECLQYGLTLRTYARHSHMFQVFACWTMLGDGSRLVVGYVGMFRTAQLEQKKCVTPCFLTSFPCFLRNRLPRHTLTS